MRATFLQSNVNQGYIRSLNEVVRPRYLEHIRSSFGLVRVYEEFIEQNIQRQHGKYDRLLPWKAGGKE